MRRSESELVPSACCVDVATLARAWTTPEIHLVAKLATLFRRARVCPGVTLSWIVALVFVLPSVAVADEPAAGGQSLGEPAFTTELVRGKVVWLAEALKSEFKISTVPEAAENTLAILTPAGRLVPIVENLRGRAFRKDDRLRAMEVEILARRYREQPFVQILKIFEVDGDKRFEVDYWCDVCAIIMFETGPCSCCQDDNRLRKRSVPPEDWPPATLEAVVDAAADPGRDVEAK